MPLAYTSRQNTPDQLRQQDRLILAPPEIRFSRFQTTQRAKAVSVGFAECALVVGSYEPVCGREVLTS